MTPKRSSPQSRTAPDRGLVRRVAARLRRDEAVDAPPLVIEAARKYLEYRATYDKRRATVRALAAQIRAGKNPRIPAQFREAVRRHLAYRDWYNADRRAGRAAPKPPETPAKRVDRRILGRRRVAKSGTADARPSQTARRG